MAAWCLHPETVVAAPPAARPRRNVGPRNPSTHQDSIDRSGCRVEPGM